MVEQLSTETSPSSIRDLLAETTAAVATEALAEAAAVTAARRIHPDPHPHSGDTMFHDAGTTHLADQCRPLPLIRYTVLVVDWWDRVMPMTLSEAYENHMTHPCPAAVSYIMRRKYNADYHRMLNVPLFPDDETEIVFVKWGSMEHDGVVHNSFLRPYKDLTKIAKQHRKRIPPP